MGQKRRAYEEMSRQKAFVTNMLIRKTFRVVDRLVTVSEQGPRKMAAFPCGPIGVGITVFMVKGVVVLICPTLRVAVIPHDQGFTANRPPSDETIRGWRRAFAETYEWITDQGTEKVFANEDTVVLLGPTETRGPRVVNTHVDEKDRTCETVDYLTDQEEVE